MGENVGNVGVTIRSTVLNTYNRQNSQGNRLYRSSIATGMRATEAPWAPGQEAQNHSNISKHAGCMSLSGPYSHGLRGSEPQLPLSSALLDMEPCRYVIPRELGKIYDH